MCFRKSTEPTPVWEGWVSAAYGPPYRLLAHSRFWIGPRSENPSAWNAGRDGRAPAPSPHCTRSERNQASRIPPNPEK